MPYTLIKGEFHIHYPDTPRNGPRSTQNATGDRVTFLGRRLNAIALPAPGRWLNNISQPGTSLNW
jgi:hypothetical protein